jgi:hypothetical protein
MAEQIALKALEEMGHTSRTAIEAMERLASSQRPAVRLFVSPVGESCGVASIGDPAFGAVAIDRDMRQAIEASDPIEISGAAEYEVLISEFDLKNRSCKFSLRDQDDPNDRFNGEITDPVAQLPQNPYSDALNSQRWIRVKAKAQLKSGELEKLFISDLASRALPQPG